MRPKQIFWLLIGIAAFSSFAADLRTVDGSDGEAKVLRVTGSSASRNGNSGDNGWLAGQTVLQRESDGHFYANATVGGSDYRFLVDTGASFVALTGRDAQDMGFYWDEANLQMIGRGANGAVYGVPVMLDRMEVDGFEARNVPAAIIPEGLHISLLGQSFLSRIDNVEISGNEMRLGN